MNKWQIGAVLAVFIMTSSASEAGFDKNPTSALKDRRETAESAKEQVKLLKDLIAETKRTNQLLEELVNGGRNRGGGDNGSSAEAEDSGESSGSNLRRKRR